MRREAERRRGIRQTNVGPAGRMVDYQEKRKQHNYERYLKRLTELYNERREDDKQMDNRKRLVWTPEMLDRLVGLVDMQMSPREIAQEMELPEGKVRSKLAKLKAMTRNDEQERFSRSESAVKGAEQPVPVPAPAGTEPEEDTDEAADGATLVERVVYYALDESIMRLQADNEEPALYFRQALGLLDLWVEGLREQIERTPVAMAHWASIGAIIAYQELTGRQAMKGVSDVCRQEKSPAGWQS